jgi:hypothetical protein
LKVETAALEPERLFAIFRHSFVMDESDACPQVKRSRQRRARLATNVDSCCYEQD